MRGAVALLNAPQGYAAALGVAPVDSRDFDFVQVFVRDSEELRRLGAAAIRSVRSGGLLWVSFPKGGKTVGATDLPASPWWRRRDVLGDITGIRGWVPVAQVAIDYYWTALRFKHGEIEN